ncbi:hypothetical protein B0H14DRAFT_3447445 [Mycena olivaceomarginata]|nr:hypothetical protein B0H14DRAFT_3447445 [Mycena olivaceomarginata]
MFALAVHGIYGSHQCPATLPAPRLLPALPPASLALAVHHPPPHVLATFSPFSFPPRIPASFVSRAKATDSFVRRKPRKTEPKSLAASSQPPDRIICPSSFSAHPHQYRQATTLSRPFWPGTTNAPQSTPFGTAALSPAVRQSGCIPLHQAHQSFSNSAMSANRAQRL